jgi:hypothetical protein
MNAIASPTSAKGILGVRLIDIRLHVEVVENKTASS